MVISMVWQCFMGVSPTGVDDLILRGYKLFDLPSEVEVQYSHFAVAHCRTLVWERYLVGLHPEQIKQKVDELRRNKPFRRCLKVCTDGIGVHIQYTDVVAPGHWEQGKRPEWQYDSTSFSLK